MTGVWALPIQVFELACKCRSDRFVFVFRQGILPANELDEVLQSKDSNDNFAPTLTSILRLLSYKLTISPTVLPDCFI